MSHPPSRCVSYYALCIALAVVAIAIPAPLSSAMPSPVVASADEQPNDSLALESGHSDDAVVANHLVAADSARSENVIDPGSVGAVKAPETYALETEGIGSRVVSVYDNSQSALNKILNVSHHIL